MLPGIRTCNCKWHKDLQRHAYLRCSIMPLLCIKQSYCSVEQSSTWYQPGRARKGRGARRTGGQLHRGGALFQCA